MNSKHAVHWFEIPVAEIDRAAKFYSTILGVDMKPVEMAHGVKMAVFPNNEGPDAVHGALVQGEGYIPSDKGTLVILNAGEDLSQALSKVERAGGEVLLEKFSIGEHGFIAYLRDTEGNKVALHSMK